MKKFYGIFTNLINNAIKYTSEGSVDFGYHLKDERETQQIEFYVQDTGMGIPKNIHHDIFDRFVQADLSLSSKYEGAGLGLSITKAYIELLHGRIWVESEEGVGSTFYFTIQTK
jgi:signal transduction histidine kinase